MHRRPVDHSQFFQTANIFEMQPDARVSRRSHDGTIDDVWRVPDFDVSDNGPTCGLHITLLCLLTRLGLFQLVACWMRGCKGDFTVEPSEMQGLACIM
jgi:hypothetical protein